MTTTTFIPLYCYCDVCGLVSQSIDDVMKHESRCNARNRTPRENALVFTDSDDLIEFLGEFNDFHQRLVRPSDGIYYTGPRTKTMTRHTARQMQ